MGILVAFTVFLTPNILGEGRTDVQREGIIKAADEWIIQFDITNHEGKETDYIIESRINNNPHRDSVRLDNGKKFTYIHHILQQSVESQQVSFAIFRGNESEPIEEINYYLK